MEFRIYGPFCECKQKALSLGIEVRLAKYAYAPCWKLALGVGFWLVEIVSSKLKNDE